MEEVLMTTKEIAAYFGIHEMTTYRQMKKGGIPAFKVGGQWRTKKSIIDDFIRKNSNVENAYETKNVQALEARSGERRVSS